MNSKVVKALAGELEGADQKVAASIEGDIEAGTRKNPQEAAKVARDLAQKGYYAVGLLNMFAGQVATFDGKVTDVKSRLETITERRYNHLPTSSTKTYADIKKEVQIELEPDYTGPLKTLDNQADRVAALFNAGDTLENVRLLFRRGLIPLDQASLWLHLNLTPQDTFEHYQALIAAGLMPNFPDMTEEERQAFIEENPGLLASWLQIDHPPVDVQTAIISLALPHVDSQDGSTDAYTVLAALESGTGISPERFQQVLQQVGDVNAGFALLAPWAARNGVDLTTNATVADAQSYLKTFVAETYSKKNEIIDYIRADEHNWRFQYTVPDGTHYIDHNDPGFSDADADALLSTYADGILNLSNADLGGGFEDLPEQLQSDSRQMFTTDYIVGGGGFAVEVQEDNEQFRELAELLTRGHATPGEGLAEQMASTAVASMSAHNEFWRDQPGDDFDPWGTDLASDILDMVSRNREATADLVAGVDVPGNYPSNFNATIFDEPWDLESGDEAQVAKMYSWMHEDYAAGGEAQQRADLAFDKLTQDLTAVDGDNFKHLMGDDGESAARRNTLLTQALTDALSDHLGEFAAEAGTPEAEKSPLSEADRIRLMTFIASDNVGDDPSQFDYDRGAARLTAYVNAYQRDQIVEWAADPTASPRTLADGNGRLQGFLDAALINEAQERGLNANDAEAERIRNLKIGAGIAGALAGKIPVVGDFLGPATGIGNTLLSNLVTADHMPAPDASLSADWQADGSHITVANTVSMVDALVESGALDPADLPPALRDPSTASNAELQDAADTMLTDYFRNHPPHDETFYDNFADYVNTTYNQFSEHYNLHGQDDNHINEFLTDPNWGRP